MFMNEFVVSEAVAFLESLGCDCTVIGSTDRIVNEVRPIKEATTHSLGYVRDVGYLSAAPLSSISGLVIVPSDALLSSSPDETKCTVVGTSHPEASFYKILRWCTEWNSTRKTYPEVVIEAGATIGSDVTFGPFTFVSSNVVIGDDVQIGSGCSLRRCIISDGVILQDGVRIGGDALGSAKDEFGMWIDRPSLSRVQIGRNTRIEDNTVIQCGYMRDTDIGENVRIGPSTLIGNGARIGAGTLVAQGVTVAGSVDIGQECQIWGRVSIREGLRIGERSIVGMGSVVLENLDGNRTYVGVPARELRS